MTFHTQFRPEQVDPSAFVAGNATVVGDVTVGPESSLWFGVVARGDVDAIRIGAQTNIQDNCVLHGDPGEPCLIGDRVTVGHAAIIHGATVENDVLIGMRSVVLNGAIIGHGSLVAAGAMVTEGTVVPPGSLVLGSPAKVRGPVSERHQEMIRHGWKHYVDAAAAFRERRVN